MKMFTDHKIAGWKIRFTSKYRLSKVIYIYIILENLLFYLFTFV